MAFLKFFGVLTLAKKIYDTFNVLMCIYLPPVVKGWTLRDSMMNPQLGLNMSDRRGEMI
jgi:hypothetical protein